MSARAANSFSERGEAHDAGIGYSDENNIEDMYLTFGVGGEVYGVGIAYVTEIIGMQRIMPVPDVPAYVKGVINLRGKVIAVMDVRARFGMPEEAYTERTVIIVLDVNRTPTGLVVDDVRDVLEIPAASIDASPASAPSGKAAALSGDSENPRTRSPRFSTSGGSSMLNRLRRRRARLCTEPIVEKGLRSWLKARYSMRRCGKCAG